MSSPAGEAPGQSRAMGGRVVRRIDRRWIQFGLLTVGVVGVSMLIGVLPVCLVLAGLTTETCLGVSTETLVGVGLTLSVCANVVGFSWLIVRGFDMFEVEQAYRDGK